MRKRYFFFLCLLFFVQIGYCQQLIQINNNSAIRDIGKDVWVLEDKTNAWSIHDILQASQQAQFRQSHLQVPNWGATTSSVWVKIYINIPQNGRYFLEVSYPILSQLDFYAFKDNGQYEIFRSGNSLPFEQRILKNNHFYFELSPNCHTYYLRATSYEILQIPIKVGKIESFFEQNQANSILNGVYFGFVILIIFYNFFLYISTKERIYLSYVLYVFAVGLVTANLLGYNFQFLYPNFPQLNFYASILYPLNFFVLIFSMDFFNIKEKAPQYRKGFQILIYICVAEIGLNLLGFPHLMFQISQVVGLLVVGYILFVTSKLYGRGYRPAKFFLIAFTTFLSGIIITILLSAGVISYSLWAYHSIQIGSAVEIVLLSFAVADKINIYKRETAEAQLMALQKAEENQRIISAQKEELENKVKERTLQIEKQKEEILTQNESLLQNQEEIQAQSSALEEQNIKLSAYQKLINEINYDLQMTNAQLEVQVEERTLALTQANEELIKQNHQLEEYAFVTAHQLRAPVARLLGLASIFDFIEMGKNSYNADIVRKMQAETTYLDEIIKDLSSVLAFQKGES
nr:hypothetical protein [Thermoflexibacter sp.]